MPIRWMATEDVDQTSFCLSEFFLHLKFLANGARFYADHQPRARWTPRNILDHRVCMQPAIN